LCRCTYYVLERARSTMLTEASSSLPIRQSLCSFTSSLDLYEYKNIVCSYPPEYCEFGSHLTRCKEWLESTHPDLFVKYWSDGESWSSFISAPSYPYLFSKPFDSMSLMPYHMSSHFRNQRSHHMLPFHVVFRLFHSFRWMCLAC
jgi:hypothetical protein